MRTEFIILIIAIASYLNWAVWYHRHDKSLTLAIFMEYLLTAVLALVLILGVIYP